MKRFIYIGAIFIFTGLTNVMAQIPYHVPNPANNTPIDLRKPSDIIIYLVLPIIAVILNAIAKKHKKKRNV